MTYFCFFSLGGNLDFPDFLQKKFYNINYWGFAENMTNFCGIFYKNPLECNCLCYSKFYLVNASLHHGKWLWHSWHSNRFLHQSSVVQIQSSAISITVNYILKLHQKDENKGKRDLESNGSFM